MRKLTISHILLMTAGIIILTGCSQPQQQVSEREPLEVGPTFTAQCVAYYYKSNQSAYITKQTHGFNPDADLLKLSAQEPIGLIECTLRRDSFIAPSVESDALMDLPSEFCSQKLASAVFYSFCAASNLLDTASMTVSGSNVKIQGQLYTPLSPAWPNSPEITLYRSVDSNRVELVRVDDQDGTNWLLRSYNLQYHSELDKKLPLTIDVFSVDKGVSSKELMIRFDYKDIRKITP